MKIRYFLSQEKATVIAPSGSVVLLFEPEEQRVALHAIEAILDRCDEEEAGQFLGIIELLSEEGVIQ